MSPLVAEQAAFLLDLSNLIQFAREEGWVLTGGELWRSPEQQAIYLKSGRSKTMHSNHLRRCAIDLNFFWDGKLIWDAALIRPIGNYWESLCPKNRWGGNFKGFVDVPHFERS
jgi:peptidoglycan L-alanyl-D-glutamate endopeptidase CwlK